MNLEYDRSTGNLPAATHDLFVAQVESALCSATSAPAGVIGSAIEGAPGTRIQDLAAASLLSRSGTSRAVDRLARAGHVERQEAEEDGRGAYAALTRSGREHFFAAAREHVALVRREFLSHFSHAEQETLADFWKRLEGGGGATAGRRTRRGKGPAE